jgi:hypothetical protein
VGLRWGDSCFLGRLLMRWGGSWWGYGCSSWFITDFVLQSLPHLFVVGRDAGWRREDAQCLTKESSCTISLDGFRMVEWMVYGCVFFSAHTAMADCVAVTSPVAPLCSVFHSYTFTLLSRRSIHKFSNNSTSSVLSPISHSLYICSESQFTLCFSYIQNFGRIWNVVFTILCSRQYII